MRRIGAQEISVMQYLGRISGNGNLRIGGETVARASYEIEGFAEPRGGVMSSGELSLAPSHLKAVFGRVGLQLLTDDGRLLDVRFSEKALRLATEVVHVEVTGDLASSPAEWRAGSTSEPIRSERGSSRR